jgi:adenylate kinase family enzyme
MKKIIVIGCPGSGKSCFSKKLHSITGIPLYHLDMMYWKSDKTTVEKDVFYKELLNVLKRDEWIIDGNYASTMELRMQVCDTVIFLDYPVEVCLEGIRERRGKKRSDIPWIEMNEDAEFVEFIKNYNCKNKPEVINLLEKYSCKDRLVFEKREQADEFLSKLENRLEAFIIK